MFASPQRHDECADQEPTECSCGLLRDHILPPWAIYPVIKVHTLPHTHNTNSSRDATQPNISPALRPDLLTSHVNKCEISSLFPEGETKQREERQLGRWQRPQHHPWRTSPAGYHSFLRVCKRNSYIHNCTFVYFNLTDQPSGKHPPSASVCESQKWRQTGREVRIHHYLYFVVCVYVCICARVLDWLCVLQSPA